MDLDDSELPFAFNLYDQQVLDSIAAKIKVGISEGSRRIGLRRHDLPVSVKEALGRKGYKVDVLPWSQVDLYQGMLVWISW